MESKTLKARYMRLRRSIVTSKHRLKTMTKVFQLNIFPNEVTDGLDLISFDEPLERDQEKRELRSHAEDLEKRLAVVECELREKEEENGILQKDKFNLSERNIFLSQHANALEKEVCEVRQESSALKQEMKLLKQQEKSRNLVHGRKPLADVSKHTIDKTKAAYRRDVVHEINAYGANRGLTVDKIILEDATGRQVEVNARKRNTYDNLNPEEKRRVRIASLWKDSNRVSDKVYSSLAQVGKFPAGSHVKRYEGEINALIGNISRV